MWEDESKKELRAIIEGVKEIFASQNASSQISSKISLLLSFMPTAVNLAMAECNINPYGPKELAVTKEQTAKITDRVAELLSQFDFKLVELSAHQLTKGLGGS